MFKESYLANIAICVLSSLCKKRGWWKFKRLTVVIKERWASLVEVFAGVSSTGMGYHRLT